MATKEEAIRRIQACGTDHVAMGLWEVEDILLVAEGLGVRLNDEQADEILDAIDRHQNSELGINWTTLNVAIDEFLRESEVTRAELYGGDR